MTLHFFNFFSFMASLTNLRGIHEEEVFYPNFTVDEMKLYMFVIYLVNQLKLIEKLQRKLTYPCFIDIEIITIPASLQDKKNYVL